MALEGSEGMGTTMLVQPSNGYANNGFGFGNDGLWILILFFLLCGNNGWGNGFGNNGAAYEAGVQRGFDQSAVMGGINGINASLNTGFGDIQQAFASAEVAANARQTANLQQMFALQSQFANCCCENRLGTADLKYTVATENCANRAAISDGIRDILAAQSANTQRILDQMCNDKIDSKNEKIADLQRQLTMANLAASQNAQTAAILANNEAQTTALEQYLAPVPRPAYIVQNPSCCAQYGTCGCGS